MSCVFRMRFHVAGEGNLADTNIYAQYFTDNLIITSVLDCLWAADAENLVKGIRTMNTIEHCLCQVVNEYGLSEIDATTYEMQGFKSVGFDDDCICVASHKNI